MLDNYITALLSIHPDITQIEYIDQKYKMDGSVIWRKG